MMITFHYSLQRHIPSLQHELADWTLIFLIGAVIDVFSNVLYLIFAKAEPQPFDKVDSYAEVELEGEPEERKQKN